MAYYSSNLDYLRILPDGYELIHAGVWLPCAVVNFAHLPSDKTRPTISCVRIHLTRYFIPLFLHSSLSPAPLIYSVLDTRCLTSTSKHDAALPCTHSCTSPLAESHYEKLRAVIVSNNTSASPSSYMFSRTVYYALSPICPFAPARNSSTAFSDTTPPLRVHTHSHVAARGVAKLSHIRLTLSLCVLFHSICISLFLSLSDLCAAPPSSLHLSLPTLCFLLTPVLPHSHDERLTTSSYFCTPRWFNALSAALNVHAPCPVILQAAVFSRLRLILS
ncbi:hypothetical protein C8J57DRAFT_1534235 [Mycena rebaudengoi]|nr:hypothetical protein C8J57DRAFT_1534235 [Mycena rebaudengoi]